MEIALDLSRHCIETEVKRLYERSISDYFKAGVEAKPLLERTIAMLHQAIETMDFPRLRAQFPPLAGGTGEKVALSFAGDEPLVKIGHAKPIKASKLER
jgi:hypothetical protein